MATITSNPHTLTVTSNISVSATLEQDIPTADNKFIIDEFAEGCIEFNRPSEYSYLNLTIYYRKAYAEDYRIELTSIVTTVKVCQENNGVLTVRIYLNGNLNPIYYEDTLKFEVWLS